MDVDAFVAAHRDEWRRLDELVRRRRRLASAEVDELVDLYQRAATHLSAVRSASPDPALLGRLSTLVAGARAAVTGAHAPAWRDVARFARVSFPAAAYRARWWWLGTAVAFCLTATAIGAWVAGSPQVQASVAPPDAVHRLVAHDFAAYYREFFPGSFAARVATNNIWVAALSVTFGILLGVPVIYVLLENALNVGVGGGLMVAYGYGREFFALVLPHGMLELTAIFLAAAVGLRLGWTVIDPGPRRRAEALAAEGRAAVGIAVGLSVVLTVSGCIEAFVTPSPLPTWARIGIGAVAEAAFVGYVVVFGRRAVRAGHTGDLAAGPDTVPVAA